MRERKLGPARGAGPGALLMEWEMRGGCIEWESPELTQPIVTNRRTSAL